MQPFTEARGDQTSVRLALATGKAFEARVVARIRNTEFKCVRMSGQVRVVKHKEYALDPIELVFGEQREVSRTYRVPNGRIRLVEQCVGVQISALRRDKTTVVTVRTRGKSIGTSTFRFQLEDSTEVKSVSGSIVTRPAEVEETLPPIVLDVGAPGEVEFVRAATRGKVRAWGKGVPHEVTFYAERVAGADRLTRLKVIVDTRVAFNTAPFTVALIGEERVFHLFGTVGGSSAAAGYRPCADRGGEW
jgi:hypothetical protein